MGIRGLSSYIQARSSKYLRDHELQNTTVVVDGNNFACAVYLDCPHLNVCFGGDYNVFYNHVRDILNLFKRCKLKPIMVFDGGLDIGNRKHRQRLIRAKGKVISSIKVKPSNQHRMRVLPVFFKLVLLDLLKEMKIEVIQCNYEADQEIAALARGLKCPVISNDSDFYVMDVMLIPLSSMELSGSTQNGNSHVIRCKIYEMDVFLKCINYEDCSVFPLLGTLLGNDYVDARKFENIYSHISIPKSKTMPDQHRRITGLLDFLRGESVEDAIDRILSYVKKVNRIEVEVAIRTSLKAYADEDNQQEMTIESLKERIVNEMIEDGCPEWFSRSYCRSEIQSWITELMFCRKMPFHSQLESSHMPYTFTCPRQILKAIALICLPSEHGDSVLVLSRKHSQLIFKRVTASPEDFNFPLPKLPDVISLSVEERQQLLFDILLEQNDGRIMEIPKQWQLVCAAIIFWTRHSLCPIYSYHVDALICSLIQLSIVEPRVGRIRSLKRLENIFKTKKADDPLLVYLTSFKNTFKFGEGDERMMTHDIAFDRDLVHTFGEFQAVLCFALILNRVLATELDSPNVGNFYNGTFIYHAAVEFRTSNDRLKIAQRLYAPPLLEVFKHFTAVLLEASPPGLTEWNARRGTSQPRKRNKKNKEVAPPPQDSSSPSSDEVSVNEDDIDVDHLISNRFHMLKLNQ